MTWVSEYDFPNRIVTLRLVSEEPVGRHWTRIVLDERLSDPDGDFLVFCAPQEGDREAVPVKVVLRLNEAGGPLRPHRDFDPYAIGSPTLWLADAVGEVDRDPSFPLVDHWVWFEIDSIWRGDEPPTAWPGRPREDERADDVHPGG